MQGEGQRPDVIPIADVVQSERNFAIKGRIKNKTPVHEGKTGIPVFSFVMCDDEGEGCEIEFTAFGSEVDLLYNLIGVNQVYKIENPDVQLVTKT